MSPAAVIISFILLSFSHCSAGRDHRKLAAARFAGEEEKSYVVVFDGGSTGTRLHVYCFDEYMQLVKIGDSFEVSSKIEPGLSAYADKPQEAAKSLIPLLEKAEKEVSEELRPTTPLTLGATGGLRNLPKEKADQIIAAVRDFFRDYSSLEYKPEWVRVIDGSHEGAYMWVAMNYLLGNIGKDYSKTAAVVDLGGASVQMAYGLSEAAASNAPNVSNSEEPYVTKESLNNTHYYLYSHSYLNYGMEATRAQVFQTNVGSTYSYCLNAGYKGIYKYNGKVYNVSASPSGSDFNKCRREVYKVLNKSAFCSYQNCTFGGVCSGGGGEGQKDLFIATNFYYRADDAGIVDHNAPSGTVSPLDYKRAARVACSLNYDEVPPKYPTARKENWPFMCMDLMYHYTLLVHGFGVSPSQKVTVIYKVKYNDAYIEATWTLGSAIDILSSEATSVFAITKMLPYWRRIL